MNNPYGSAPIFFMDEEKRKEWESLDPQVRKSSISILHQMTKRIQNEQSIEILCNIIMDLNERLSKLEREKK